MAASDDEVSVDIDVGPERTVITVTDTKDAALVVETPDDEQIYLPPEDFSEEPGTPTGPDSPYGEAPADSPYEGSPPADSPYESAEPSATAYDTADESESRASADAEGRGGHGGPILGVESTPEGFRVVHPDTVQDVRLLRGDEVDEQETEEAEGDEAVPEEETDAPGRP